MCWRLPHNRCPPTFLAAALRPVHSASGIQPSARWLQCMQAKLHVEGQQQAATLERRRMAATPVQTAGAATLC
jgi:hypothetical protein